MNQPVRLRLVDAARLNPDTIMPPYYRLDGLVRVAKNFDGKTLLTGNHDETLNLLEAESDPPAP